MMPWKLLDSAQVPERGEELRLYRRDGDFSIRVDSRELMNSRVHGSEGALAELACVKIAHRPRPRVLIGGLGIPWIWGQGCIYASRVQSFDLSLSTEPGY